MRYKRLKWHMYGTIFPTFAKCRSHAYGFTRILKLYWPRYVVIDWFVFSLKATDVVVSLVKNGILTSKHSNIIVITTTEQYFSPLPEKFRYPSISLLCKQPFFYLLPWTYLISHKILVSILYTHEQHAKC